MGYDAKKDLEDLHMFIDVLPHKLKIETCLYIYEERYSNSSILETKVFLL